MSKQGTIIVVDDNKGVLSAVKLLLKNHFEHIVTLPSPITLPAALREENAQVVLLDMNFSSGLNTGNEGLYWLHEIKKIHPSLPVVLFTAYADIDLDGDEWRLYVTKYCYSRDRWSYPSVRSFWTL